MDKSSRISVETIADAAYVKETISKAFDESFVEKELSSQLSSWVNTVIDANTTIEEDPGQPAGIHRSLIEHVGSHLRGQECIATALQPLFADPATVAKADSRVFAPLIHTKPELRGALLTELDVFEAKRISYLLSLDHSYFSTQVTTA